HAGVASALRGKKPIATRTPLDCGSFTNAWRPAFDASHFVPTSELDLSSMMKRFSGVTLPSSLTDAHASDSTPPPPPSEPKESSGGPKPLLLFEPHAKTVIGAAAK